MTSLEEYRWRRRVERLLEVIAEKLDINTELALANLKLELNDMTTSADIQARLATLATSVEAGTNATGAVAQAIEGLKSEVVTTKQQLADYIAAHPGDAELQAIADNLDAIIANVDADTLAEQALANTDEAPPVEPSSEPT